VVFHLGVEATGIEQIVAAQVLASKFAPCLPNRVVNLRVVLLLVCNAGAYHPQGSYCGLRRIVSVAVGGREHGRHEARRKDQRDLERL